MALAAAVSNDVESRSRDLFALKINLLLKIQDISLSDNRTVPIIHPHGGVFGTNGR
jgi:hypothetical protein